MSLVTKRKIARVDYTENTSSSESDGDGEHSEKKQVTTRKRQKKDAIRRPSKDIWKTLPAELKNDIYELVLTSDDWVGVRMHNLSGDEHARAYGREGRPSTYPKWKLPSLFLVSKQIKREAQSVYYSTSNKFEIGINTKDLQAGLKWVTMHFKQHDTIRIRLNKLNMKTVVDWFPIAKFIVKQPLPMTSQSECAHYYRRVFGGYDRYWHEKTAGFTLMSLVMMAVKARFRGVTYDEFMEDFQDWAITAKGIHQCSTGRHFVDNLYLDVAGRLNPYIQGAEADEEDSEGGATEGNPE